MVLRRFVLFLAGTLFVSLSVHSAVGAQETAPKLAERHAAKGIPCAACHGEGAPTAEISSENCLKCHGGNYEKLAEKTADRGDINFHDTHIGEANCTECHKGHTPPQLVCNQCHEFEAKVP